MCTYDAKLLKREAVLMVEHRDPNASQFSLSGTWVMSQFKILIDEREEAKRNFEQLKAEIGSVNSGLGEPSSSSNPQPKASVINEEEASEVQYASTHVDAIEYASPNLSTRPNLAALTPNAVPAAQMQEPKSVQAKTGPGDSDGNRSREGSSVKSMLVSLMHAIVIVFCCPCVYCDRRQKQHLGPRLMDLELPEYIAMPRTERPTAVSAETAYQTWYAMDRRAYLKSLAKTVLDYPHRMKSIGTLTPWPPNHVISRALRAPIYSHRPRFISC
jgi:hypothetical protein